MEFRKYSKLLLLCIVMFTLSGGVINYLIDPYWMFGASTTDWLNLYKPFAGERGRTSKLYQVERIYPRSVIVGNSRPEMGLDPEHSCWPTNARPIYNTALPGLGVFQQVRYAQHAVSVGNVSIMLIGLDFLDFLNSPQKKEDARQWPPAGAQLGEFSTDTNGTKVLSSFKRTKLINYLQSAFSLKALAHSVISVARQNGNSGGGITQKGFNDAEKFYKKIITSEGVSVLFRQKNREIARQMNSNRRSLYRGSDS